MKKLVREVMALAIIALLLLSSFILATLLIGRSNWQKRLKQAEAGNVEEQKLMARLYATGGVFVQSGLLLGKDISKARYWRQKVCASTGEKEFCAPL